MVWLVLWLLAACVVAHPEPAESHDVTPDPDAYAFFHYKSRPDIEAPRWTVEVYEEAALQQGDQYWFVSPYLHLRQRKFPMWNGPHIYRTDGDLIWAGASFGDYNNAHDFRMSYIEGGKPVLSVIYPKLREDEHGWMLDETYTPYRTINTRSDLSGPNMHEFNIVDDGKHALIITGPNNTATHIDEKEYTGPCRIGWQGFAEIDIATNEVLFEWYAQEHVTFEETTFVQEKVNDTLQAKCAENWDIMHINSVDKFANGDYLISARHANTLYRISHADHSILWRLGGDQSDFIPQSDLTTFSRQHHSRIRSENSTHILLSLFNNAVGDQDKEEPTAEHSSGLILSLNTATKPMTVEVVHQYIKPIWAETGANNTLVVSRGSMELLSNGNVFLGWVNGSHISEHASDGRLLMQAVMMKEGTNTYRCYKMPWTGRPAAPPDVFIESDWDEYGRPTSLVYVSWNGATEVASWNILPSGGYPFEYDVLASAPRKTFETLIALETDVQEIVAVALDRNGNELGRSRPVEVPLVERPDSYLPAVEQTSASSQIDNFQSAPPKPWLPAPPSDSGAAMQTWVAPRTFYFWISVGFIIGFCLHQYLSRRRKLPWVMSLR